MEGFNVREYPENWKGNRSYVWIAGWGLVARCYTINTGGKSQVAPEYGGPAYENKRTGAPMVMRDIGAYTSPLDGSLITSRSQHREHMRVHDVIEVGNEPIGDGSGPKIEMPSVGKDIKRAIESLS